MNIYISGSMAYDRIMDFPGRFSDHIMPEKIHILNVCFTLNGMVEKFGGTAGNIAYSLSLLKEKPLILATIGRDYINYFEWLRENRIAVDAVRVIENEFTASAYITTDHADNQITAFNPGAMKYPSEYDFNSIDPLDSIVILAPGNLQDMRDYARICREKGIRYICDPGQSLTLWDNSSLREWIDGSFILISNDYELGMIMKITGLDKRSLINMAETVITTLGEGGSVISSSGSDISIPAAKTEAVVDPTGAGDAFRAGLIKGIVTGRDIGTSAKMGAVAAAYAVEKYGTQEHFFSLEDFASRYKISFGEVL